VALSGWLVDKSALLRLERSEDDELWAERIGRGLVRVSTVTRLEMAYSARSGQDLRLIASSVTVRSLIREFLTPAIEERALEVQALLADRGQHRAPSIADLLIAATAELRSLAVLHLDRDFELIAEVTGQPVESLRIT
jgi:predicted nucleic acid-binding protein